MTREERAERYVKLNFGRIAEEMPICEGMKTIYLEATIEQKIVDEVKYTEYATRKEEEFEAALAVQRKELIDKACEFMYNFHLPNGVAPLYDYVGNLRRAMEDEK